MACIYGKVKQFSNWQTKNPAEEKQYLCKVKAVIGSGELYECLYWKDNNWYDTHGDIPPYEVLGWKEIK